MPGSAEERRIFLKNFLSFGKKIKLYPPNFPSFNSRQNFFVVEINLKESPLAWLGVRYCAGDELSLVKKLG